VSLHAVIAPYLDARGFVPRVYGVREDGYPIAKVDGPRRFCTCGLQASALHVIASTGRLRRSGRRSPIDGAPRSSPQSLG
jgi:hypothetical protein